MPSRPLEPGDPVRLGRFELLGRLGEGGQGVVYLGRGTNPGEERVAVKVLRSTVDAYVMERLARELDAIHQVQPFVTAGVIEASAEGDRRYVVSEFIDGPSLQERVDTRGPLSEGDLQRLAVGTATALTAIHGAGVVHRDFKPANVLLGPDGPRVVDFGIARLTDAATITSGLIGTPSYVAPEQLAGVRPTSAVDIFAWAVTIIYAATGRLAFGADSVPAVMHRIMDKEPDRRPSARDLLLRLVDPSVPRAPAGFPAPAGGAPADGLVDSVPHTEPQYPPAGLSMPARPAARSRRTPILVACSAAAAALVVLAIVLLTRGSPPTSPAARAADTTPATQATSSPPATTGATVPAAFAGTWKGTAAMSAVGATTPSLANTIAFTFVAGERTIHETDQDSFGGSCVNTLTLTEATDTVLTFGEPQAGGCVAGTVTFTRHGSNLAYRWTDNIEQNTATLSKS
jgi:predicted Ser/Thr protein kinase